MARVEAIKLAISADVAAWAAIPGRRYLEHSRGAADRARMIHAFHQMPEPDLLRPLSPPRTARPLSPLGPGMPRPAPPSAGAARGGSFFGMNERDRIHWVEAHAVTRTPFALDRHRMLSHELRERVRATLLAWAWAIPWVAVPIDHNHVTACAVFGIDLPHMVAKLDGRADTVALTRRLHRAVGLVMHAATTQVVRGSFRGFVPSALVELRAAARGQLIDLIGAGWATAEGRQLAAALGWTARPADEVIVDATLASAAAAAPRDAVAADVLSLDAANAVARVIFRGLTPRLALAPWDRYAAAAAGTLAPPPAGAAAAAGADWVWTLFALMTWNPVFTDAGADDPDFQPAQRARALYTLDKLFGLGWLHQARRGDDALQVDLRLIQYAIVRGHVRPVTPIMPGTDDSSSGMDVRRRMPSKRNTVRKVRNGNTVRV
jgi:hypothetical protein